MGIEEETDRTVFIRNLDTKVTEELLFELFLQAGPLVKTKIPKDLDGKQKTFGFAVYKHDVSVPYAVQLLNGTSLYGRNIHVQFRSGSSHGTSPGNSQNSSPASTPNPHSQRTPVHFSSPPYTPPPQMQRSFSSPDNLQKHVTMNNMMWQTNMKQLEQLNGVFTKPPQRQTFAGGKSGSGDFRHHDSSPYRHHTSQNNSSGRSQRYADESGSGRHQQQSHSRESHYHHHHHQSNRSGNRHFDSRGGNKHYDDRGSNRGYQESRWQRY
ncbi:RNA-binding protein 7 [Archocentrus centrarchus]|uniref:RNA-binding protein 7 n=1 Tax=Archocentrus centrarchus TaxID=63155 RepID=UPI0011EA05D1|nr:RNA-binding protein 7-like [Archocentrus centrarchus]